MDPVELLILVAGIAALVYAFQSTDYPSFDSAEDLVTHDTGTNYPPGLLAFANAIGIAEGYGQAGTIPTIYKNPGDLKLGDIGFGVGPTGITKFDTDDHGKAALYRQLGKIADGTTRAGYTLDMSFYDMANKWAEGDSNWAINVAASLGVSPDSQIGSFL